MIIVVVGKRRNTTTWFSGVGEKTARTATANRTNRNLKLHEPQPRIARTATANCTHRNRKLHEPQPQTARTATANRTNRTRKPHEPQRNRSVNLFLGSTVYPYSDHDLVRVLLTVDNASSNVDPGVWKLNVSLLKVQEVREQIASFWDHWKDRKRDFGNVAEWWTLAS
jgi:hypothetical protein